ncbi:uncharacterized protein LOC113125186 [Mastacembelus armatus]|uniref:uncharacterized protein LOC113125186 n=1 Tax=Mastacembelus armatus TaxID=205130 RepID=UPI000E45D923|nr:uncharacterized protein LOC113125186 [Mastacembelus armatus]
MTGTKNPSRVLLVTALLLTGVRCNKNTVFVYSTVGGDALLPCTSLVTADCSLISWTFFKDGQVRFTYEVSGGQVRQDSDKFSRMSITSNCSIHLHELRVDDAGSYMCLNQGNTITAVYLSLLTITSISKVTDLQLGGKLILSCVLFTYYDAGSCKIYSSVFSLRWATKDGTELPRDSRYEMTDQTRCNITLVTKLQRDDNNRKWRCQVDTAKKHRAAFQDFTSTFLLHNPSTVQALLPSATMHCHVQLPISRIVLCVALPFMVVIVGFFTWRTDQRARASTNGIELQELN